MKVVAKNAVTAIQSFFVVALFAVETASAAPQQTEVDFKPYMTNLQRRIKLHWHPNHFPQTVRIVVLFKIHLDGTISDLKFEKQTTSASLNNSTMQALQAAAPFDPLPPGCTKDDVNIRFTFDYNSFLDIDKIRTARLKQIENLEKAVAQKEIQLGQEHEAVAIAARNLADEVSNQGNYAKAEPLYKRAVAIQEKHLPATERELAITLTKFGELYYLQKRYADAEPLYKEALGINEKFSENNAFLQADLEHYAKLLYVTNRMSQANEFYDRLKELRNKQQKIH